MLCDPSESHEEIKVIHVQSFNKKTILKNAKNRKLSISNNNLHHFDEL